MQYYITKLEDLAEYDFPFERIKQVEKNLESMAGEDEEEKKEEPKVEEVKEEEEKKPMTDLIKKRFTKCAERAEDAMQELGALNEKLTENITLMIPQKTISLLREWEEEVKSISMQVEKIIAADDCDVSVNAFSKKATDNMDKLKKQIQLVGDLVQQVA